jgi:exodeoxyribonuclease-1
MTRALRPEGIVWPVDAEGRATNRLELITKTNDIAHENAHDALSDVTALIDVCKLLRTAQPNLFEYLLKMRDKKAVKELVNLDEKAPFVYTSGRYEMQWGKTTVAFPLTGALNGNVLVYDLRYDPADFTTLSEGELAQRLYASWPERQRDGFVPVPVKTLQYNRCPAVAPLGVLEGDGWERIGLNFELIERHRNTLLAHPEFAERLRTTLEKRPAYAVETDAETRLYDGFIDGPDKLRIETVRNADARELADFHPQFDDDRLGDLLLRYKARNYPTALSEDEATAWEAWRASRLTAQLPGFLTSLQRIATEKSDDKQFLLEELQLWAESVMPAPDEI